MIDQMKIELAIHSLLLALGEDPDREGLLETPKRMAKLYKEVLSGALEDPAVHLSKTFTVDAKHMVVEKDIPFYSMCEHHMMPFFGTVHVAYLPNGRVVGLSKLVRTVECFARRLQIQERMTQEIADAIMTHLSPRGVIVMVEAQHLCVSMRGVKKPGSQTVTMATTGDFAGTADESRFLTEQFMRMIRG
ncbi:MAG: GTP cyclohydrolase I FolE [Clostridium sp.]|jgi:GTP cyclohydrolase I|nr:GTP cyclohydrolase I FolE [Clostridium sp.]